MPSSAAHRWMLCIVIFLAILPFATPQSGDKGARGLSLLNSLPISFHLGQSYGTSAVILPNETIVGVAKIPGWPAYTSVMEAAVPSRERGQLPWPLSNIILPMKRAVQSFSRPCARNREIATLAEMLAALREATKAALGVDAKPVYVSAPHVPAWESRLGYRSVTNHALKRAGMEPWTWSSDGDTYLTESNAMMAALGKGRCIASWCTGHYMRIPEGVDEVDVSGEGERVFYISLTNRSLYTLFQWDGCYWSEGSGDLASIDPTLGRDRAAQAGSRDEFWDSMEAWLLSLVREDAVMKGAALVDVPLAVWVVGEAADDPDFVRVVHAVVDKIPSIRAAVLGNGSEKTGSVQLVVPEDGIFMGAKGAAVWMQSSMDKTYCDDFDREHGIMNQYDMKDSHDEL